MPNYRYQCMDCGKTFIGAQIAGGMTCNCTPPKKVIGTLVIASLSPLSPELTREVNITEATSLRAQMCRRWNITNKSHLAHGSNFSGNQKIVNLIHNIVDPVSGTLRTQVRDAILREFRYDIDSRIMA